MAFTRNALFLKHTSGSVKFAFKIRFTDYRGDTETKPTSYARSLYDGGLLAVKGSSKRRFTGTVIGEDSASGTANDGVEDIDFGDIDELKACWEATDLQVKGFSDSAYWSAEWMGDWDPEAFTVTRLYALIPIALEAK